jgi:hypothetical protein
MGKRVKSAVSLVAILILLLAAAGLIDYLRVRAFEKPIFARASITADDGGSGKYQGIGYAIDIKGNFMPEDEYPGVTRFTYYIFGRPVDSKIRD